MIVWLNGVPGTGQRAVAEALVEAMPGSTLYEPELIAGGLRMMLPEKQYESLADFRELPAWRRLVVDTAAALLAQMGGGALIVPMTLVSEAYRDEIFGGLAARGIGVRHVLLRSEETVLRGDRMPAWVTRDAYAVDAGGRGPEEIADALAAALTAGAGDCAIVQTPEPTGETIAAGVLLFDEEGRVLLVDPTYKPGWEFPGGVVERGEAPARAGVREVAEELGIELDAPPRLLVVDWEPPAPPRHGGLRLLFDGGLLDAGQRAQVLLPGPELRAWRFASEAEAEAMLPPVRYTRLRWALRARARATALNLEAGVPVG
ncbi:NUDIX domain-containing protein [Streptomyces boninensis]|uniref:NUDIX hydrolase n=1 Tax=Streptomyces boninensis TaxID=2039455 RepID=UPI003B21F8E7